VLVADDPQFRTNIRLISDEAAYLERLVSDLLVFSRMMDTGEALRRKPFSCSQAVHNILEDSREISIKPAIETVQDLAEVPLIRVDLEKKSFSIKQIN